MCNTFAGLFHASNRAIHWFSMGECMCSQAIRQITRCTCVWCSAALSCGSKQHTAIGLPYTTMATEQSFWTSAKNFFSFIKPKVAPTLKEGDRKETPAEPCNEKIRYRPAKLVNADNTYLYQFGSLNMP
ncbi:hypothetical protein Y032_0005g2534 [Ancylostoma ceylanicum]|uniref:Uncharacterized protein n=1 Tax=Ancylostoma ceylanicum TaxID=53326 RepID=A0A016VTZ9_9BILA|nr:hypothetical protein Y032_0005g2534 [Ancylostoma ceylanicum]